MGTRSSSLSWKIGRAHGLSGSGLSSPTNPVLRRPCRSLRASELRLPSWRKTMILGLLPIPKASVRRRQRSPQHTSTRTDATYRSWQTSWRPGWPRAPASAPGFVGLRPKMTCGLRSPLNLPTDHAIVPVREAFPLQNLKIWIRLSPPLVELRTITSWPGVIMTSVLYDSSLRSVSGSPLGFESTAAPSIFPADSLEQQFLVSRLGFHGGLTLERCPPEDSYATTFAPYH